MKKVKLNIQEVTDVIKKEILKEMNVNNNTDVMNFDDNYWDQRIENAKPFEGELEDIPEDKEYDELLSTYIDSIYKIRNDLEVLISDLSYFNDTHSEKENLFINEVDKLNNVLNIIKELYNSDSE